MNNNKLELAGIVAFLGAILGGFIHFMAKSGIPADIAAKYGVAVKDLFWVASIGALVVASLRFVHYWGVAGAGADPLGTGPRETYDALRENLDSQKDAEDAYARGLKTVLAMVDRFFGDAGALGQRAFLLSNPAPLWTARALDRCLLLAMSYPSMAVFLFWALSGEIDPVAQALQFKAASGASRSVAIIAIGVEIFALFRFTHTQGKWRVAWLIAAAATVSVIVIVAGPGAGAIAGAIACAVAEAGGLTGVFAGSGAGVVAVVGAIAGAGAVTGAIASSIAYVSKMSAEEGWQEKFLSVFLVIGFAICLTAAGYSSSFPNWNISGPLLLFLSLLTLVNAPFFWLSLGFTRLLVRRGIEQGGPWPYFLALIDALLASALIALLAIAMVSAADLFNHLAEAGGGEKARVLPPMQFYLAALRAAPQAPEYWWVYATLFSTMIPSVINLFIAGFSLLRGLPMLRKYLLGVMREGEAMPATDRIGAAAILTLQGALTVVCASGAQIFLTYVVLWQIMPRLGLGILDLAERIAM